MRHLTATLCLTLAVLLGSARMGWGADFQKGLDAVQRGDYTTALREWNPLAEQGVAFAQFNLGVMYANGLGVPQNYNATYQAHSSTAGFEISYKKTKIIVNSSPFIKDNINNNLLSIILI